MNSQRWLGLSAFLLLLSGCRQILGLDDLEAGAELDDVTSSGSTSTSGGDSTAVDSHGSEGSSGGSDCLVFGGAPSEFIPPFTSPSQDVDGFDDDFCGVPSVAWVAAEGGFVPVGPAEQPDVVVRLAWSTAALHVFAQVHDTDVRANPQRPYLGDAFEVFVSSTDELSGDYDGTEDAGAIQVLGTVGDEGPIIETYPQDAPSPVELRATAVSVADGYVVEMFIPWRWSERITIDARIGLDVALDSATGDSLFSQALLCLEPVENTSCSSGDAHPSCDNRTWCRPRLDRG